MTTNPSPLERPTPFEQNQRDGQALRRIAREVRELVRGVEGIDPSVFADLDTLEEVGRRLETTHPIVIGEGIRA